MKNMLLLPLFLLLAACGDGKSEAAKALADEAPATNGQAAYVLDLTPFDMPLVVHLPEVLSPDVDSLYGKASWNEEFGQLRVMAGDGFGLTITEDDGDMPRLKGDLERHMLLRNTILQETPDLLVYSSQFPDEELVFIHFYKIVRSNGRTFVVESLPDRKFNEAEVQRMANAVHPVTPS